MLALVPFEETESFGRGCLLALALSVIIWICIIAFGYWIYRWGIRVD